MVQRMLALPLLAAAAVFLTIFSSPALGASVDESQKWDRVEISFCRDVSHSAALILHLNPHAAVPMDHFPGRKYPHNTLLRSEKALTSSLLHAAVWGLNNYRWVEGRYTLNRADEHVFADAMLRERLRVRFGPQALLNPGDYGPLPLLDTLSLDLHRDPRLFRPLRNESSDMFRMVGRGGKVGKC